MISRARHHTATGRTDAGVWRETPHPVVAVSLGGHLTKGVAVPVRAGYVTPSQGVLHPGNSAIPSIKRILS